jgi:hypothetical protein
MGTRDDRPRYGAGLAVGFGPSASDFPAGHATAIAWETIRVGGALQTKGWDEITTLPYRTLAEGAAIQPARSIGAAVVADAQGRILGMLSERAYLQAVGSGDPAALADASSKHMMTPVVATEVSEWFQTPTEKENIPALPPPTGRRSTRNWSAFVSIGGVVKRRLEQIEHEHEAMREYIATA